MLQFGICNEVSNVFVVYGIASLSNVETRILLQRMSLVETL